MFEFTLDLGMDSETMALGDVAIQVKPVKENLRHYAKYTKYI